MIDATATVRIFERNTSEGGLGRIHLDNPKALNALTLPAVRAMAQALAGWQRDPDIAAVLVTGEGERAFCAGGDVKGLAIAGPIQQPGLPGQLHSDFFREEYQLNALIAAFPKPYLSLWDGVVMGGGVGISIMGSHRLATERLKFAMPETAIGFFPDVGGGYFLSRAGAMGRYLALTGIAIGQALACEAALASHALRSADRADFLAACESDGPMTALARFRQPQPPLTEADQTRQALAARCFSPERSDLAAVRDALAGCAAAGQTPLADAAEQALQALAQRSPLALAVTDAHLRRCANLSFNRCLELEYDLAQAHMVDSDFFEGVRALLIDKDHRPRWRHGEGKWPTEADIARMLAPMRAHRLNLP